jgi:hypothetical protein
VPPRGVVFRTERQFIIHRAGHVSMVRSRPSTPSHMLVVRTISKLYRRIHFVPVVSTSPNLRGRKEQWRDMADDVSRTFETGFVRQGKSHGVSNEK